MASYMTNQTINQPTLLLARPNFALGLFVVLTLVALLVIPRQTERSSQLFTLISISWFALLIVYEWARGRYADGKKSSLDWQVFGISLTWLTLVERPLLYVSVWGLCLLFIPQAQGSWSVWQDSYFWWLLLAFVLIDELLHGWVHNFAHSKRPSSRFLQAVQSYYKAAHRLHHLNGGPDNKGQLSATHTICVSWGWAYSLPNYWFGAFCLYMGLVEVWAVGALSKSLWGIHNHANLTYDRKLLTHSNRYVRAVMRFMCHILVFPNQHHAHHSRSKNSAKNVQNFIAIYDWLLWKTFVITTERPKIYGWRQKGPEVDNAFYRFFHRDFK